MASKRLTKEMRKVFVDAVMKDVPRPAEETCSKELQNILRKHMPAAAVELLDTEPQWLENRCFTKYSQDYHGTVYMRVKWVDYDKDSLPQEAKDYVDRVGTLIDECDMFRDKLRAAVEGCKTIKDIKDALPELEKYCPDDTPAVKAGLPVVANLMAEAVRRGWPGGKIVNAQVQLAEAA